MEKNFAVEDIREVIKSNKDNEYPLRLVVKGENKQSKNWNITEKQALLIACILEVL
jgi:hypothetical protein